MVLMAGCLLTRRTELNGCYRDQNGLQRLKYLLSGPLQKKSANSCSRTKIPDFSRDLEACHTHKHRRDAGLKEKKKKSITAALQSVLKLKELTLWEHMGRRK